VTCAHPDAGAIISLKLSGYEPEAFDTVQLALVQYGVADLQRPRFGLTLNQRHVNVPLAMPTTALAPTSSSGRVCSQKGLVTRLRSLQNSLCLLVALDNISYITQLFDQHIREHRQSVAS
jgi:hypothetical protein